MQPKPFHHLIPTFHTLLPPFSPFFLLFPLQMSLFSFATFPEVLGLKILSPLSLCQCFEICHLQIRVPILETFNAANTHDFIIIFSLSLFLKDQAAAVHMDCLKNCKFLALIIAGTDGKGATYRWKNQRANKSVRSLIFLFNKSHGLIQSHDFLIGWG